MSNNPRRSWTLRDLSKRLFGSARGHSGHRLRLERLEDRIAPSVSANLNSGVLNIRLNADGDAATVSAVGPTVTVSDGTNTVFTGSAASVQGINAQGNVVHVLTSATNTHESVALT